MIEQITIKVDAMVIPVAERCAKESGLSLSDWVNQAMWDASGEPRPGFGTRWRGAFNPEGKQYTNEDLDRIKQEYLTDKYLQ